MFGLDILRLLSLPNATQVASLLKQSSQPSSTLGHTTGMDRARATPPLASERSGGSDVFSGLAGQRSAPGSAMTPPFPRPVSVLSPENVTSTVRGLGIKRSATTPEPLSGLGAVPPAGTSYASAASLRRQTADGSQPRQEVQQEQPDAPQPPAWSEELLNWMLAEKAELLLKVQRLQRRQQEMQQELDRVRTRAGSEVQDELQRLKVCTIGGFITTPPKLQYRWRWRVCCICMIKRQP